MGVTVLAHELAERLTSSAPTLTSAFRTWLFGSGDNLLDLVESVLITVLQDRTADLGEPMWTHGRSTTGDDVKGGFRSILRRSSTVCRLPGPTSWWGRPSPRPQIRATNNSAWGRRQAAGVGAVTVLSGLRVGRASCALPAGWQASCLPPGSLGWTC